MHPREWTLRAKLIASLVALFVAVTAAIGTATTVVMSHVLTGRLDDQLRAVSRVSAALQRPDRGFDRDEARAASVCRRAPPNAGEGFAQLCLIGPVIVGAYLVESGTQTLLPDQATGPLKAVAESAPDNGSPEPRTVELGDLGDYRVMSSRLPSVGVVIVSGVPLGPTTSAVTDLLRNIVVFSLLGLLVVVVVGAWLVRVNLRPLQRVAATAARVSRLPLSSGQVRLAERVPVQDTNRATEVGQVGSALNDLLDHVDRSLTARHRSETQLRQFVADASHELRTPLASIIGYAELTGREREPIPPGVRHAIGRIESESARMATLVDDLLLLARLDSGRPLDRAPVDLTRLVIDTVSDLRVTGRDHLWRLDLPQDAVEVTGDRARLTQVLVNLLNNARVHTPAGTTVTARVRQAGSDAVVEVQDDGPGIPADLIPNVFVRFTRGDAARTRADGSSGLGLSIVHAVVAAHGGDVDVHSRPGQTLFRVRLPKAGPGSSSTPESQGTASA